MSTNTTETKLPTMSEQEFNQAPFVGVSSTDSESELRNYIINYIVCVIILHIYTILYI